MSKVKLKKPKDVADMKISNRRDSPFQGYPDVLTVPQMCEMLGGISVKLGYRLLRRNEIQHLKIGRSYRIPKVNILEYLQIL